MLPGKTRKEIFTAGNHSLCPANNVTENTQDRLQLDRKISQHNLTEYWIVILQQLLTVHDIITCVLHKILLIEKTTRLMSDIILFLRSFTDVFRVVNFQEI